MNPILTLLERQVENKRELEEVKRTRLANALAESFGRDTDRFIKLGAELSVQRDKLIHEETMIESVLNECRLRKDDTIAAE